MLGLLRHLLIVPLLLTILFVGGACNKKEQDPPASAPPGGRGPGFAMGGRGGPRSPVGELMGKLARGPQSLNTLLDQELKSDPPPWDTIQPQTKEFVELASSMSKYDPPQGSKESWEKLTAEFADSAKALDRASQAKDHDAALAAYKAVNNLCNTCHQGHRGRGGMGMPGGGFGPPGGKGFPGKGFPGKGFPGKGPPDDAPPEKE
jgi:hypothetical protein